MNAADIILTVVIAAILGFAVWLSIRRRKKGSSCGCGCEGCQGCAPKDKNK